MTRPRAGRGEEMAGRTGPREDAVRKMGPCEGQRGGGKAGKEASMPKTRRGGILDSGIRELRIGIWVRVESGLAT